MGNIDKFDLIANQYDTPERIKIAKIIAEQICRCIKGIEIKSAIDFGCGTGLVGMELLAKFQNILFLDASPKMIEQVQQKILALDIKTADALCCNIETEDTLDITTDCIIVAQTLLHIKDIPLLLMRFYNLLQEGGSLVIIDYDKTEEVVSNDVHNGFEQQELVDAVKKAGFSNVSSYTFYKDKKLFMGKDATLFILSAKKPNLYN